MKTNLWRPRQSKELASLSSIEEGLKLMARRLSRLNRWQAALITERMNEVEAVLHRTGQSDVVQNASREPKPH